MPANAGAASASSSSYVWYVVCLLGIVNAVSYMDRMALSVLVPYIKKDLSLSDAQVGLLTGLAFSLFYAVCGIPIARWADRGVRRNIIILCLTTWSVMTALSGSARNFWHLFAARVGVGAGEAGCFPASASIICDYVDVKRRSGAFAVHTFGSYLGMLVGMVFAAAIADVVGWRLAFFYLGLPGLILALVVGLSLREPKRGALEPMQGIPEKMPVLQTLRLLWRIRTYRLLMMGFVLFGFVQYGVNQWWPSYYVRSFQMKVSSVGILLGVAIAAGSAVGLLSGGFLANWAARRDVRLPLKIGAAAIVIAIPALIGALFVSSAVLSLWLVALTSLCWGVSNGPVAANINSVVPASMRATANSIAIFAMSALGFTLGPLCVGTLSDVLAPALGAESLRYALIAPVCLLPLMAVAINAAANALPGDLGVGNAISHH